ncbi:4'-phosphopantetheinyl transferase superfamily protein [Streptomyces sp. CJ_13]|uniref:4'-phosphopantetheinyl transferase family protein n=1 Tax=Streptomyces TaxID=1883 RepID=UPI001BDBB42B|nr:4'-phosphopantetheinyl transferase superfamily protein [Streptomyces sp. CJ_13]MBT1183796.1 4'-phosphopantetheinyl transferase superfamily protein [Streptomyces sp. CJ_13]
MITLLPPGVEVEEAYGDLPDAPLQPGEAEAVARSPVARRREFATVRHCARTALGRLGIPPAPILRGTAGAPQWPCGVVGSMTHCSGYRAAVVARAGAFRSLGIDAEVHQPLPDGGLRLITSQAERRHLAELLRRDAEVHWDTLLFAVKESVYKAWYPLGGVVLDFVDAEVVLDPENGTFTARLLAPEATADGAGPVFFEGRWRVADGLVQAASAVPGRMCASGPSHEFR